MQIRKGRMGWEGGIGCRSREFAGCNYQAVRPSFLENRVNGGTALLGQEDRATSGFAVGFKESGEAI